MVLAMISSMLCYLIDGVYNQVELMRSIICHKVVTFGPKHLSLLLDCFLWIVRITSPRYTHSCFITSICITFFSDVESFFLWVSQSHVIFVCLISFQIWKALLCQSFIAYMFMQVHGDLRSFDVSSMQFQNAYIVIKWLKILNI